MKVGELYVELGVDADTPTAKEFQSVLNSISMESLSLVAGLTAVSFKLKDMLEESMNAAAGFKLFRNQSGLSTEELQKWQIMAERANISTEAVTGSVLALQRNIAEIRLGRGNLMPFQLLGIDVTGSPFEILMKIREKLSELNRPQAMNIMGMFGISPEMINIMTLTNDQFKELAQTQGLIFKSDQQENALRLKRSVVDLRLEFRALGRELSDLLGPLLRDDLRLLASMAKAVNWLADGLSRINQLKQVLLGLIPGVNIGEGIKMGRGLAAGTAGLWNKTFNNKVDIHISGSDPKETAAEAAKRFTETLNSYIDITDSQVNNERP